MPEAIHVLGFTPQGQAHLKKMKEHVQLITRIGKEPWDRLTQQADRVYQLGFKGMVDQTYGRVPIRTEVNASRS